LLLTVTEEEKKMRDGLSNVKQRSFLQRFSFIGWIFLGIGIPFLIVGIVMQLVPISPENMTVYRNGIRQPATEETVRIFRLIFLGVFGGLGLIFSTIGGAFALRPMSKRRRSERLKREGALLVAEAVGLEASQIRVNLRPLSYLRCAYESPTGETYIFKSDLLRADPTPHLDEGKVNVYYDRENMRKYFVDVDGSVELGSRVFEL